jgi:hypothetical protein
VVLVNGLAKVPALLLIPPVGVRVAELALDARRIDVTAILREEQSARRRRGISSSTTTAHPQTPTYHIRVLSICKLWVVGVGVFLVDDLPADHGFGEEGSPLHHDGEGSRREEGRRTKRRHPHKPTGQHLGSQLACVKASQ